MTTLLLAALAMAAKDSFNTLYVIAAAKGRENLAGACDAVGDLALIGVAHYGIGGNAGSLVVMGIVSFMGTKYWTRFGKRFT